MSVIADASGRVALVSIPFVNAISQTCQLTLDAFNVVTALGGGNSAPTPALAPGISVRMIASAIRITYTGTRLNESGLCYIMDTPAHDAFTPGGMVGFDMDSVVGNPRATALPILRDSPIQSFSVPDDERLYKKWNDVGMNNGAFNLKLVFISGLQAGAPLNISLQQVVEFSPAADLGTTLIVEPPGEFLPRVPDPTATHAFPAVITHKTNAAPAKSHMQAASKVKNVFDKLMNTGPTAATFGKSGSMSFSDHVRFGAEVLDTLEAASRLLCV